MAVVSTRFIRSVPVGQRGNQAFCLGCGFREIGSGCRTLQSHDQVVGGDRRSGGAQRRADTALQVVAVDRTRERLAADDESGASRHPFRRRDDEFDPSALRATAAREERVERPDAGQAVTSFAANGARGVWARLRQAESRARPLARRAESTLRPPTVFMRARKPCVRARRIFEGWNVRFMTDPGAM